jgi:hypothetical protein
MMFANPSSVGEAATVVRVPQFRLGIEPSGDVGHL